MACMQIMVSDTDPTPLYRQIVSQVRRAIAEGALQPGDQLPSLKSLAAKLGISHLTVKQAYDILGTNGLTTIRRSRGVFVRDGISLTQRTRRLDRAYDRVTAAVRHLHAAGGSLAEVQSLINECWPENDT